MQLLRRLFAAEYMVVRRRVLVVTDIDNTSLMRSAGGTEKAVGA